MPKAMTKSERFATSQPEAHLANFATKQALTFALQLGWGVEFPNQVRYTSKLTLPAATGPTPNLSTAWLFYLRLHFDARYYF